MINKCYKSFNREKCIINSFSRERESVERPLFTGDEVENSIIQYYYLLWRGESFCCAVVEGVEFAMFVLYDEVVLILDGCGQSLSLSWTPT